MTGAVSSFSGESAGRSSSPRRDRRVKLGIVAVMCTLCALLLFWHLGHYALWDDEANTALIGEGVWQTGDTSAVVGHNIVAYRGGVELSHLKERYLPPLQYYLVAPFVGIWKQNAFAARVPFAAFGLLSIILVLWRLWRERVCRRTLLVMAMGFVGNVSLWLYFRQCRYYGPAVFFSLAIVFLWLSPKQRRWKFPLLALLSIGLLATNYLNYAALCGVIAIDFALWNRRRLSIGWGDALWLFVPQLLVGGAIVGIWNPLNKSIFGGSGPDFVDRLRLFWWAWRDLNRCEFGAMILLAVAPIISVWRRDRLLMRAWCALLAYVLIVVALTPQNPSLPMDPILQPIRIFDVRYLVPAIPLIIAIEALVICRLFPRPQFWPALLLAAIAFGTNIFNGSSFAGNGARDTPAPLARSSIFLFARELLEPPPDPYRLTANWINQNLTPGKTVWVLPDYMAYPLMFQAPRAIYAWQLPRIPAPDLRGLNPAFYKGGPLPDYLICFGPDALRAASHAVFPSPTVAKKVADIDFFWQDLYRPELAWRTFTPLTNYRRPNEAIQIFRLSPR